MENLFERRHPRGRWRTGERKTGALVQAAIALGSNLGDSRRTVTEAIGAIDREAGVCVVEQSPLYKTAPIGPPQPDYINACIVVETVLLPQVLLQRLLVIEQRFGRVRQTRWGARSLDLDLLLFGDRTIDRPGLTVPHPRLHERFFVLVPLSDIAPDWSHPVSNKTVAQLLDRLAQRQPPAGVERLSQAKLAM